MIKIFDNDLALKIAEFLSSDRIVLYGADKKGSEIFDLLADAHINDFFVCDNNPAKWGKVFKNDHTIQSVFWLTEFLKKGDAYVAACVENPDEIVDVLDKIECGNTNDIRFVTYWGIKRALYENKEKVFDKGSKRLFSYYIQDKYELFDMQKEALYLQSRLIYVTEDTVLLLLPGKTGSEYLEKVLQDNNITCYKSHDLSCLDNKYFDNEDKKIFDDINSALLKGKLRIVCSVREPIARDYSAFWQPCSHNIDRWRLLKDDNPNLQLLYDKYMQAICDGNEAIKQLIGDCFLPNWVDEFEWFDLNLKDKFGIDIYDREFDQEKGFAKYSFDNKEVFLYKTESLDKAAKELAEFLNVPALSVEQKANESRRKPYGLAYEDFKKRLILSRKYVDHYYHNNEYMDHFYNDAEKQMLLNYWEDKII